MKKQTRNLCIAAAALVILGGIYLAVSSREEQPETVAVGNLADMDVARRSTQLSRPYLAIFMASALSVLTFRMEPPPLCLINSGFRTQT